ncbi:MAG: NAD(P)H-dependent glycerol-3-phosphate dehydrogenase, partial [bacterium]
MTASPPNPPSNPPNPPNPSGTPGGSGTPDPRPVGRQANVTILGVGQMGLVCSMILADPERQQSPRPGGALGLTAVPPARPKVTLCGHSTEEVGMLAQARKSDRLPQLVLPEPVRVSLKMKDAVAEADLIISAVPVQYSRSVWESIRGYVPARAAVVSVAKGIENGTLLRPTQVIAETLKDDPDRAARPMCVLSGPTIASELARCLPATMVAASDDAHMRKWVQELFTTRWMRIYTSPDLLGVELAGAMKNVIAIAAGILDGLQAGTNAKSARLARGLAEIARLGVAMGASSDTFFGIAGAGDLATSCFAPEGRNRSCGEALGKGRRIEDYLAQTRSVVEGVATTRSVMDLARKYRVDMPITAAVHAVLFENMDPIAAIGQLMTREPKAERVW